MLNFNNDNDSDEINDLEKLIYLLSKLPGFGKRSARRSVLHLIKNKQNLMQPLIKSMQDAMENVGVCEICANIDMSNPCHICTSIKRPHNQLCVVEEVADLWAIERSNTYFGRYHVLGGTLSAVDGRGPDDLNINNLIKRINNSSEKIEEIILATNATVEGQTTAYYITERLKDFDVKVSRIAQGIPMGGELDFLDDGTLGAALKARKPF